jgi:hypothetical protein
MTSTLAPLNNSAKLTFNIQITSSMPQLDLNTYKLICIDFFKSMIYSQRIWESACLGTVAPEHQLL